MDPRVEFLKAVRDDKDVMDVLKRHDIGYGWAVEEGFVRKHPAYFEFTLTSLGQHVLATEEQST